MREQPSASELLDAVADFLRNEIMPALEPRLAFHTRVAANVLDIVRREMAEGPAAEAGEAERLRALLNRDGSPAELNAALCEGLASGEVDPAAPDLIRHLWSTTLATVAIDQPNYATYRRNAP